MKKCIACNSYLKYYFRKKQFTYYKCANCLLVRTYPLPSSKLIKNHYRKGYVAGNYKLLKKYSTDYRKIYQNMGKMLEEELLKKGKSLKGLRVLDIGCFTGDFLEILKKKGGEISGVELQKEAARIAFKKFPNKIINADINKLKNRLRANSFDCVTMLGLLEHVNCPTSTLKKAARLLKKNGILMIQTPNNSSFPALITGKYWPPFTPVEHINIFSTKSLDIMLKKYGFQDFTAIRHFKSMPVSYLYQILKTFGPGWKKIFSPLFFITPKFLKDKNLLFYIGEYIYFAQKK